MRAGKVATPNGTIGGIAPMSTIATTLIAETRALLVRAVTFAPCVLAVPRL